MTRVLSIASEVYPLIKTGGLADVVGSLPLGLIAHACETRTLVPFYRDIANNIEEDLTVIHAFDDLFGGPAEILDYKGNPGIRLYLLKAPHLFDRPGGIYQDEEGKDYKDNHRRFAALAWAGFQVTVNSSSDWRPDIVHCHDWQAALAPAYIALSERPRPPTVLTIHNLAFQGIFPASAFAELRLPRSLWSVEGAEYYGQVNMLKTGMIYADAITTVSPRYAQEILTPVNGMGLDGVLRTNRMKIHGILNGIDIDVWNPQNDPHIAQNYDGQKLEGKQLCKAALQSRIGLESSRSALLLGVISRLTAQKGVDLVANVTPGLPRQNIQLALLGSGDITLEKTFSDLARRYPGQIACVIGYDEKLAHQMQAGCDGILVPSRFEPCGLTQMCALRYGTLPLVSRVGGLADTVIDANDAALARKVATGFQFSPIDEEELTGVIERALAVWHDQSTWQALQLRAMDHDVSWERPARQYHALYEACIAR